MTPRVDMDSTMTGVNSSTTPRCRWAVEMSARGTSLKASIRASPPAAGEPSKGLDNSNVAPDVGSGALLAHEEAFGCLAACARLEAGSDALSGRGEPWIVCLGRCSLGKPYGRQTGAKC